MPKIHQGFLRRLIDRIIIRFAKTQIVDGLWTGIFVDDDSTHLLQKLHDALALIKQNDAYRYKRVLGELDQILIGYGPFRGRFIPSLKRCTLDAKYVDSAPLEQIASTIVHEATHGRLFSRGIGYEPEIRHRVEDVCLRQELEFARNLPHASALLEQLRWKHDLSTDTWSDGNIQDREINWLRQDGVPNWLIEVVLKYKRLKQK